MPQQTQKTSSPPLVSVISHKHVRSHGIRTKNRHPTTNHYSTTFHLHVLREDLNHLVLIETVRVLPKLGEVGLPDAVVEYRPPRAVLLVEARRPVGAVFFHLGWGHRALEEVVRLVVIFSGRGARDMRY